MLAPSMLQAQMYFAVIAEEGNFSRAARKLRTSPSALTRRVAAVERNLKVKFFERSTRNVELTPVGRVVLPEIHYALRHSERAWELARYYGRLMHGPIRLGYSPYTHYALVRILHRLDLAEFEAQRVGSADTPEPRIMLENSVTPELIERVLRGKLHAAVGIHPIQTRGLWVELLRREPFCICLPKGHPLAQRQTVAVRDLHAQSIFWIPRDLHPGFYDRTIQYIESAGARPVYHEVRSITHAVEIVGTGFGIGLAAKLCHAAVAGWGHLQDRDGSIPADRDRAVCKTGVAARSTSRPHAVPHFSASGCEDSGVVICGCTNCFFR